MLGGGNENALAHQAGGVADFLYIAPTGRDGKAVQVSTDKDNAGGRRSRKNTDANGNTMVQPDAGSSDGPAYGCFKLQMRPPGYCHDSRTPGRVARVTYKKKKNLLDLYVSIMPHYLDGLCLLKRSSDLVAAGGFSQLVVQYGEDVVQPVFKELKGARVANVEVPFALLACWNSGDVRLLTVFNRRKEEIDVCQEVPPTATLTARGDRGEEGDSSSPSRASRHPAYWKRDAPSHLLSINFDRNAPAKAAAALFLPSSVACGSNE